VHGSEWAFDNLETTVYDYTPEQIDFLEYVFNGSPLLKERPKIMALYEGLRYERDPKRLAHLPK
jgi:hypothetical protein